MGTTAQEILSLDVVPRGDEGESIMSVIIRVEGGRISLGVVVEMDYSKCSRSCGITKILGVAAVVV